MRLLGAILRALVAAAAAAAAALLLAARAAVVACSRRWRARVLEVLGRVLALGLWLLARDATPAVVLVGEPRVYIGNLRGSAGERAEEGGLPGHVADERHDGGYREIARMSRIRGRLSD